MFKIPNSDVIIGHPQPVFTIAEIGKGFIQTKEDKSIVEYLENAKKLILEAKNAGATAVKFQTHNVEDEQLNISVISPHFSGADRYAWVKRNTAATPLEFWQEVKNYCLKLGIIFFSTPMSRGAAKILSQVDVPLWKVGSGDILDFVLLDYLASTGKPIIVSTGMSTLAEVDKAVDFLRKRTDQIVIMHCVSIYPCPPEKLNLGTIKFFEERYGLPVGFSSHSLEWRSSVVAANLGAAVIENHFTLDRNFWGADHQVSLLPAEFKAMTECLKKGDKFAVSNYGQNKKMFYEEENQFRPLFRKALVAGRDLPSGTVLEKEMIYAMRPQGHAGGLPSEEYPEIVGKRLVKDLKKYESITRPILE